MPPVPTKCYQYCFWGLLCIKLGHDRVKFVPGTASAQTSRWEGGCYVQGISPMASCHAPHLLTFQFLYVPWSVLLQGLCTSCALCPQGPSFISLLADCLLSSHPKYYHCRKLPLPTLAHGAPFSPLLCCPIPSCALNNIYLSSRMYALLRWTTFLSCSSLCPQHPLQGLAHIRCSINVCQINA